MTALDYMPIRILGDMNEPLTEGQLSAHGDVLFLPSIMDIAKKGNYRCLYRSSCL